MEEIKAPEVKVEAPKSKGVDLKKFKARKMKDLNNHKNKLVKKFNANLVLKNK